MSYPDYQQNLVLNLLGRETGSHYRKYASCKNTYRHHHQLLAAVKPDDLIPIDFDRFGHNVPEVPKFTEVAECFGFSPNGKYLAFHSHGLSMISILTYSGIDGCRNENGTIPPSSMFGKVFNFDLSSFARDHNYDNYPTLGTWWTDDSTTLVIQLSMDGNMDADEDQNNVEEEMIIQANNFVADERADFYQRHVQPAPINVMEEFRRIAEQFAEHDDAENRRRMEQLLMRPPIPNPTRDRETIRRFFNNSNRSFDLRRSPNRYRDEENTGTSRTVPFWVAIESAAVSFLSAEKRGSEREHGYDDPSVPSTSQDTQSQAFSQPHCSDEPEVKRIKKEEHSSSTSGSVADLLRDALLAKKIMEKEKEKKSNVKTPEATGYMKRLIRLLRECPDILEELIKKRGNCDHPRYPPLQCSVHKFSYADRLRQTIRKQAYPLHLDVTDLQGDEGLTMAFIAFNIEEGKMISLLFRNVRSKFLCHMRDRTLTVTYNTDTIETYKLTKNYHWVQNQKFDLSTKLPRDVFDNLYVSDFFYSPIQQDVAVVLHRDMWDWVHKIHPIIETSPEVTICHMISDDLLAVSMIYRNQQSVEIGVIVSLKDTVITVYPDYHKFLKLLFVHHIHELLPRHWTYLNASPATEQKWFKEGFIDITNPAELANFDRLKDIYHFMSTNWNNVRSTSNPLTADPLNPVDANCFLSKYIFANAEDISLVQSSEDLKAIHMEQYYHPVDPFILVNNVTNWLIAYHQRDSDEATNP